MMGTGFFPGDGVDPPPSSVDIKGTVELYLLGGACSTYGGEVHTGFWWEDLKEGDHLEDLGVDGSIILNWTYKKWDRMARTGLIWLRIGTGGGFL
jgi:hypothetical protein